MMRGALASQLADSADHRFIVRYWIPACVAIFCAIGLITVQVGGAAVEDWVLSLSDGAKAMLIGCIVIIVSVLAYLLMGVRGMMLNMIQGAGWPKPLVTTAVHRQEAARAEAAALVRDLDASKQETFEARKAIERLNTRFPAGPVLEPTVFGNTMLANDDYPKLVYGMATEAWWPRLLAVAPDTMIESLDDAASPIVFLFNMMLVAIVTAIGAGLLALLGDSPTTFVLIALAAVAIARACYVAVCNQAVRYGELMQVAFDFYRFDILKQLGIEPPADGEDEAELWRTLTARLSPNVAPLLDAAPTREPARESPQEPVPA